MADTTNLDKLWENPEEEIAALQDKQDMLRPFWSLDLDDEEKISDWKRHYFRLSDEELEVKSEAWLDNKRMVRGDHYSRHRTRRTRVNTESESYKTRRKPFPIGITGELVEQKTSKVTGTKVGVKALPPNDTPRARNSSKTADKFISYYEYLYKTDLILEKWQRAAFTFGEAFMYVEWDASCGPVDPEQQKKLNELIEAGEEPTREIIARDKDDDNRPIYASKVVHQGDPVLDVKYPWQVRWELRKEWQHSDYCFIEMREYLDIVLARYDDITIVDSEGDEVKISDLVGEDGKIPLTVFYHKETEFLALGRKVVFIGDSVVENTVHPHNKNKLPLVRLTDIDIPSERYARSFIENVKHLNRAFDGVMFLMLKAHAHAAHPKWIMPKKSANHINLAGLATIVEYTGGVPPRLETFSVLRPEMFQLLDLLQKTIRDTAAVHDVSFGDVPKRLDSSLAIQRLEDQETKRDRSSILKYREGVLEVWQLVIDLVGKHYEKDTTRLVKIVGQDETISIEEISSSELTGPFELRIVGTSALPETLAGKTDRLIALRKEFGPGVVPDPFVIDALDLAQPERYISYATVAVRKAEAENDRMLSEQPIQEPKPYEDLIAHWQSHMKVIQSTRFEDVPEEVQRRFIEHLMATEFLMWEKTTQITGRGFSAKLQALDGWPALFRVPEPEQPQGPGQPVPLQEGNAAQQTTPAGPVVVPGPQPGPPQQGVPANGQQLPPQPQG